MKLYELTTSYTQLLDLADSLDEEKVVTNKPIAVDDRGPQKTTDMAVSEKTEGQLYIACHPWANIILDGRFVETTPMLRPITLPAGIHLLELENPNYLRYSREISIKSGVTDTLTVALQPATGYLNVQVIPWGEIYINNQYLETTPLTQPLTLSAGKHRIGIKNPNHPEITDSITITAGETVHKVFSFNH